MGFLSDIFGGGSKATTQSSAPWGPSQGALKLGLKDAEKLYKKGTGGGVYTGKTYVDNSAQTNAGRSGLSALARQQASGAGVLTSANDIMNQGGFNDFQVGALKNMQRDANAAFSYSPEFESVLGASLQDAREGVNANASAAGRYGSGVAQSIMARELGDLSSKARLGEYYNHLDRKTAANTNLFNAAQAGLGNMKDAYGVAQLPFQTQMQIGAMDEDLALRKLNDKIRIFQAKQDAPWNQIGRLNTVASGAGQMGSTKTETQPGQNPWLTAAGYGLTGLGALGGGGLSGFFG